LKSTVFRKISQTLALSLLVSMFVPALASAAVTIQNVRYSNDGIAADVYTNEYNSNNGDIYLSAYADSAHLKFIASAHSPLTVQGSTYFANLFVPVNTSVYGAVYLVGSYGSVSSVYPDPGTGSTGNGNAGTTIYGSFTNALLDGDWLYIHSAGTSAASNISYYHTQVSQGNFVFQNLPDGQYIIDGYYDSNWTAWHQIPFTDAMKFTVQRGQTNHQLSITLPQNNVSGKVRVGDQTIVDAWLNLHSTTTSNAWFSARISNGSFSLYLPDGSYVVDGYSDPQTYAFTTLPLKYSFSVKNGYSDPQSLDIIFPSDNVTGSVYNGTMTIDEGWLSFSSLGAAPQWYSAKIKNSAFHTYLPDGQYEVEGYTDSQGNYTAYRMPFTVAGGKLETGTLNIQIPGKNVTGTVVNGSDAWLMIESSQTSDQRYYVKVDNQGMFSLHLSDGSFRVAGYYDMQNQTYHQIDYPFTVYGGVSNPNPLKITVPTPNVTGSVVLNNQNVNSGWLNVHSVDLNQTWYTAKIQDGAFKLYLPAGQYQATGYWDDQGKVYTDLNYSFTVTKGQTAPSVLTLTVPPVSLQGSLQNSDGTPIAQAWVYVKNANTNEVRGFQTQSDGSLSSRLPVGTYNVIGFSTGYNWYPLYNQSFSITADNLISPLSLQLKGYDVEFTGKVTQSGQAATHAWVLFKNASGNYYYSKTDETGTYEARIPQGKYTLVGVYVASGQGWYLLNQPLTAGAQTVTQNIEVKAAGQQ
jgi:hypothetical protein